MTSNGSLEALSSDQSLDVNNNEQSVINSSHVEFCSDVVDEIDFSSKDTQRYLTAKYPKERMGQIRKRLAVEDWLEQQMQAICKEDNQPYAEYECPIDLDELMELVTTAEKIDYIKDKTSHLSTPPSVIKAFTDDLIEKTKEL